MVILFVLIMPPLTEEASSRFSENKFATWVKNTKSGLSAIFAKKPTRISKKLQKRWVLPERYGKKTVKTACKKLTDKFIAEVDKHLAIKEQEIMDCITFANLLIS
jgi:ribosome recycling factor